MPGAIVLQVLGTSDVRVDGEPGQRQIEGLTLADVQDYFEILRQELLEDLDRVDFPLIRTAFQHLKVSPEFVVLLTDQRGRFTDQQILGEGCREIISSDGHWWQEILQAWCKRQGIGCHCIRFAVPPEAGSGVADWEAMAERMTQLLGQMIRNNEVHLHPDGPVLSFESLFIQHSSGTPALSSALYLWGIEQKLANKNIKFLYLSRPDEQVHQHDGSHWQWRLKVPQIQQLLAVQDFAGILQLVRGNVPSSIEKDIRRLDRAVSFNLRESHSGLSPEEEVLERIAIACWSEKGFRERGQWMHWMLRIAGAFELVLKHLIVHQGEGSFSWQREPNNRCVNLYHRQGDDVQVVVAKITAIADGLQQGRFNGRRNHQEFTYTFQPVPAQERRRLSQFQQFYCGQPGWVLSQSTQIPFADIRNNLYHSLQGDAIDQVLDQKTQSLGSVAHQEHPAQVAIGHLWFLIELAGIRDRVQERVSHYQGLVEWVREQL